MTVQTGIEHTMELAPPRRKLSGDDVLFHALTVGFVLWLLICLVIPVGLLFAKSLRNTQGAFVGWQNYVTYFSSPNLVEGLQNSLFVATITTVCTIALAFPFAFALTRSRMPGKGLLRGVALLKLLTPSMLPAIALRYLLGTNGYLNWMLGDSSIYGPIGIVIGLIFYTFPHALLLLTAALALADARLYESAISLGASRLRVFMTVILPGAKLGIASAIMVVFMLAITDFSVPKVTGGSYNVLAIDIYTQVIGLQNFGVGAVVAAVLIVPALVAFGIDLLVGRRHMATLTTESVPFVPKRNPKVDWGLFIYCSVVCAAILTILGVAVWASLLQYWPYNLSLTLRHYDFSAVAGTGLQGYFNSLRLAFWTAVFGTALTFCGAYLVEKGRAAKAMRSFLHLLSMLPLAVPGLVLGLGFVFFFISESNPLSIIYGTMAILVVSTIVHYYPVSHLIAVTALKQMDDGFEAVSASLRAPAYRVFWRVTVPVCLPAILDISMYFFVTAMTTTSAVIFLYAPTTIVGTISIINLDESGFSAPALAMGVLLAVTSAGVKFVHWLISRHLIARTQTWRQG